jgi:hypothetical protein
MTIKQRLVALMKAKLSVLLVGTPATAKTALIRSAAKAAGFKCIIFRVSLCERVDFSGTIVPDVDAGVSRLLPLKLLKDLMDSTEPTILFLDELGQGSTEVQGAVQFLWDSGMLPPSVLVWAATNRVTDRAGVTALCEPLRSRFDQAYNMPTPDSSDDGSTGGTLLGSWPELHATWLEFALAADYPLEITTYHTVTAKVLPSPLYQWKPNSDSSLRMPDFRTWATAATLWREGFRDSRTFAATLGKPEAAKFLAFCALRDGLPLPEDVWADPLTAVVPKDAAAQYFIAAVLAVTVLPKQVGQFLTYIGRLETMQGAFAANAAVARLGSKIATSPQWQPWYVKNQHLLSTSV